MVEQASSAAARLTFFHSGLVSVSVVSYSTVEKKVALGHHFVSDQGQGGLSDELCALILEISCSYASPTARLISDSIQVAGKPQLYLGGHQDRMCPGWYIEKWSAEMRKKETPGSVLSKVWPQGKHVRLLLDFSVEYGEQIGAFNKLVSSR